MKQVELAQELGISKAELAKQLGVSMAYITMITNGKSVDRQLKWDTKGATKTVHFG